MHNTANMLTDMVSKMDEHRQIHAKLLPLFNIWRTCVWKTIRFLNEFAPFIIEKYPLFRENGYEPTLWSGGGHFINPYTKHMSKLLSILCVLCLFFLYVVVVNELTRFHGPYCLGHFTGTFMFVAITKDRNQTTARHHRSQTLCKNLVVHPALYLQ